MVVGNGLIAKIFYEYKDNTEYLIFASGVSNSNENNGSEFEREFNLIKKYIKYDTKFIYFSTINNDNKKYFKHKRNIENYISEKSKNYLIFRLPNVVGNGGNINNIFNFFKQKIKNDELLKIKDVNRSLIDIEDIKKICIQCFFNKNKILNISKIESIKVIDIINIMSNELNKKAIIEISYTDNTNSNTEISSENSLEINDAINTLNIDKNNYTYKLLKKYIKNDKY
jgi:nucleoside-diphosphate-sugar epimerase